MIDPAAPFQHPGQAAQFRAIGHAAAVGNGTPAASDSRDSSRAQPSGPTWPPCVTRFDKSKRVLRILGASTARSSNIRRIVFSPSHGRRRRSTVVPF